METEDILKLKEVRSELVKELDFELIAPALLQYKLITVPEYETVSRLSTDRQIGSMLDLLPHKSCSVLRLLGQALQEDYDWLANTLAHVQVSPTTRLQAEQEVSRNIDTSGSVSSVSTSPNSGSVSASFTPSYPSSISSGYLPPDNRDRCKEFSSASSISSLAMSSSSRPTSPHKLTSVPASTVTPTPSSFCPSPVHSSEFSFSSSHSSSTGKRSMEEEEEFSEDAIQFVQSNPRAMRRWANLAHQVGMTNRVEVIKHRVRSSGGDFDEHVGEFLREWREEKPQEATLSGLCSLLRSQGFNDTANQLEDGSYMKKRRR